jgi:hypothetical protein
VGWERSGSCHAGAAVVIRVNCPACGRQWEYGDYLAGLTAVCKACGGRVPVPALRPQAPAAADAITATPGATPAQAPAAPSEEAIQPPPGVTPSPPPATAAPTAPEVRSVLFDTLGPPAPPDWATEHAAVALRVGQSVAEIEQRLVARGLTPAAAAAAVSSALEGGVRGRFEPLGSGERRQRVHRTLAAVVACVGVLLGYFFDGGYAAGKTLLGALLPLACVWFPGAMARSTDPVRVALLRGCGWLALLGVCGFRAWLLWMNR